MSPTPPPGDATIHMAYCSACDRQVRVRLAPVRGTSVRGDPSDLSSLVCLDCGDYCTGVLCPFGEQPGCEEPKS